MKPDEQDSPPHPDLPIGKMMGESMRKMINGKMPPKRKNPPPEEKREQDHVRG